MGVVRTPDERFADLPDYPFVPNYVTVAWRAEPAGLRMHYVDEGPRDAPPVLLMHGQPTWSYLYRKVIPLLAEAGHRVIAPDMVGYGKSDKPTERTDYTVQQHLEWMTDFVRALDLREITVVGQDWGGPIGLGVLAAEPDRFARAVVTNTILHTSEADLKDRLVWANYGIEGGRVVVEEALLDYIVWTQRVPEIKPSAFFTWAGGDVEAAPEAQEAVRAWDAPFPGVEYTAGLRQMTILIPVTRNDPAAVIDMATWAALREWQKPLLTAFSDGDPATRGWAEVFQERVPGAKGPNHVTIRGAGHFVQQDQPEVLARTISTFIRATEGS